MYVEGMFLSSGALALESLAGYVPLRGQGSYKGPLKPEIGSLLYP